MAGSNGVVENTRVARGRVVQRHVLYLGEINDTQELEWRRSIEVLERAARARPVIDSLQAELPCLRYFSADQPAEGWPDIVLSGSSIITGHSASAPL
jgi:hypothetical protein